MAKEMGAMIAPLPMDTGIISELEVKHWTTAKEVAKALSNADIKDQRVMVAIPFKRMIKPRHLPQAITVDTVGIYPIVAIQEAAMEDGTKVLVFIGSEDQPPVEGPIEKRKQAKALPFVET